MVGNKSKHEAAFEEFVEKLKEELGESLIRIVLYGSVARGQEREESDIDVFLVVKTRHVKEKIYDIASDIGIKYGVYIAPLVRTEEEFHKLEDSTFTKEVTQSGITA